MMRGWGLVPDLVPDLAPDLRPDLALDLPGQLVENSAFAIFAALRSR